MLYEVITSSIPNVRSIPDGGPIFGACSTGAPEGRVFHSAVWTGDEMVVWGGQIGYATNTGGRYDPISDDSCGR